MNLFNHLLKPNILSQQSINTLRCFLVYWLKSLVDNVTYIWGYLSVCIMYTYIYYCNIWYINRARLVLALAIVTTIWLSQKISPLNHVVSPHSLYYLAHAASSQPTYYISYKVLAIRSNNINKMRSNLMPHKLNLTRDTCGNN